MKNVTDYTIFNSIDPTALLPKAAKPLPFPLENFDQDIANAYEKLHRMYVKLQGAEKNPINNTPARKKKLKTIKYKIKTAITLLKEASDSCSNLWF